MPDKKDLLIEIGTEELPPKSLLALSEAFRDNVRDLLQQSALHFASLESFATPRRLSVLVHDLDCQQDDQEIFRRGPSVEASFDNAGNPTKAVVGFARSCGTRVEDLEKEETPKGTWMVFRQSVPGKPIGQLVPPIVEGALAALPIAKRMRWADRNEEFVRPVHWVVLLAGEEEIPERVMGLLAGRETRGHRFHCPEPITLQSAASYQEILRTQGKVEPSFGARRARIGEQLHNLAEAEGGNVRPDPELLDEVTSLCEWPVALLGRFDEKYLEIPSEVLVETMQSHQKYFPVFDRNGKLLARFVTISNIESRDADQVLAGNERVIRPRFADAEFFWLQDLKRPLSSVAEGLKNVLFQEKLGSLADKTARMEILAREIAVRIGLDPELAGRAAQLAKADLLSSMTAEFPKLQGIMGRHYAEKGGENPCVAAAIEEHYLPRKAGDRLPSTPCGVALAIADRLDTLVGIFAIGQRPTGIKDPYALRRAALGVLRILIETPISLDLRDLLELAALCLREKLDAHEAAEAVLAYMIERLRGYYEEKSIPADVVEAVLAREVSDPSDIDARVRAVHAFRGLPESASLAAANKRIRNILRRSTDRLPTNVSLSVLREPTERHLAQRVQSLEEQVSPLLSAKKYAETLGALTSLEEPVDAFFDDVMVMVDDAELRRNRLALLRSVECLFLQVADLSRLQ